MKEYGLDADELRTPFTVVNNAHNNFYENDLDEEHIQEAIDKAARSLPPLNGCDMRLRAPTRSTARATGWKC